MVGEYDRGLGEFGRLPERWPVAALTGIYRVGGRSRKEVGKECLQLTTLL